MVVNPHQVPLFGMVQVTYSPKNIGTFALQVTRENIGALSIEFESELKYDAAGTSYFQIDVGRRSEIDPDDFVRIGIQPGDWLVILWDEYRLFRDYEFKHTFRMNSDTSHEPLVDHGSLPKMEELENRDIEASENDFAPGGRGLWAPPIVGDFASQHGAILDSGR